MRVVLIRGRNLPSMDLNGLSDPFVKLSLGGVKKKSKVLFLFSLNFPFGVN